MITTVQSNRELLSAFQHKADSIRIADAQVGNPLLLAGRVQNGLFPKFLLERLAAGGECKVSLGEGLVISVNRLMAMETAWILKRLEENGIELDIEEVKGRKINIYYGD